MTTRIRVTLTQADRPVEVIDQRDGSVAATLRAEGDVFEDSVHGAKQFVVAEHSDKDGNATRFQVDVPHQPVEG
jgi:hypothetical protein